jgi:peroxiredoxin
VVPDGPRFYQLIFALGPYPSGNSYAPIVLLYINNGDNIQVNLKGEQKIEEETLKRDAFLNESLIINGSVSNQDYYDLRSSFLLYSTAQSSINQWVRSQTKDTNFDYKMVESFVKCKDLLDYSLFQSIIVRRPINHGLSRLMRDIRNLNHHSELFKQVNDFLSEYDSNAFHSYDGKQLKNYYSKFCKGEAFYPFVLPNSDGKELSLNNVISKSKLTLVNFWSWNSYEVDTFHQELKKAYEKYKGKGLSIVGVYSDTSSKKFKFLSQELPWTNVSDLKGENGIVQSIYHEIGDLKNPNTTNVLLDNEGKIIAWDVYGVFLEYYIRKYLN